MKGYRPFAFPLCMFCLRCFSATGGNHALRLITRTKVLTLLSSRETVKLMGVSIVELCFLCDPVAGDVSFATISSLTLLPLFPPFLTKSSLSPSHIHIAVSLLQLRTKPNLSLSLMYIPSLRRLFFAPFHHPVCHHILPSSCSSAGDSSLFSQHFLTLLHKVTRPLNLLNME